jgi:peptide deformylase
MAKLELITYGNPLLRRKAEEVKGFTKEISFVIRDMEETLSEENGIGLAAPQIGISKQILIIDLTKSKEERKIALLNPKIIYKSSDEVEYEEGCLSVPGVWNSVKRPNSIKIKGILASGKTLIIDASDLFARALQHETDHLEGKLFIDYLSSQEKDIHKEKIEEILDKNKIKLGKVCL